MRLTKKKPAGEPIWTIQQLGVNYWYTYYPAVNWMYARSMLTLSTPIELHTKYVNFVLDYTQDDIKSEIFMKLPIGFVS